MKTFLVALPVLLLFFAGAAEAQNFDACSDQLAASTQAQNIAPQPHEAVQPQQATAPGFQRGYVDGIEVGGRDRADGKGDHPHKYEWYRSGTRCYRKQYGDKTAYKTGYRQGFDKGYAEAYGRGDRAAQ